MVPATTYRNALPLGTMLQEYRLDAVLGAGAFGMTYLCWDAHLEKKVAIKEYLPVECALRALDGSVMPITTERSNDYQWGLDRFLLEARTLAKFSHPNIVRVNRFFSMNGTAYVVMDYEEGEPLSKVLKDAPNPDDARLLKLTLPLLDGLQAVHEAGFLHRDIKPANVFIRKNGTPVLLDFGAARQALSGATKTLTAVLTPGYAPLEQYASDGNQGPWTDIYALGGVLYRAVMNENPPEVTSRLRNDMVSARLRAMRGRVGVGMLSAIDWALTLDEKQRPQTVVQWREVIERGTMPPVTAAAAPSPAQPTFPPTVRIAPAASAQVHPIRPAAPAPAPAAPASPKVRSTPPPNAMAYPQSPPIGARAAVQQARPIGIAAVRTNADAVVNQPRTSLHWGWAVLIAAAVGAAVWIGLSHSRAASEGAPQSLTFETATGPVTIHGRVVSIGKGPAEPDAAVAKREDSSSARRDQSTKADPSTPTSTDQASVVAHGAEIQVTKAPSEQPSSRESGTERPSAQQSATGFRFDGPQTIESSGLIQHASEGIEIEPAQHALAQPSSYSRGSRTASFDERAREPFDRSRRPDGMQPPNRGPGPVRGFFDADQNRDGHLSRDESYRIPALARRFEQFDTNGDGRISLHEFERLRHALPPPPQPFPR